MKFKKSLSLFLVGLMVASSMGMSFAASNNNGNKGNNGNNGNKNKVEINQSVDGSDIEYSQKNNLIYKGTIFNVQEHKNILMLKEGKGHVYKYEVPDNARVIGGTKDDLQKGTTIEITNNGSYDIIKIVGHDDGDDVDDIEASVTGRITDIDYDRYGNVIGIHLDDPTRGHYFKFDKNTIVPRKELEIGMKVTVEYDGTATSSLPAQSTADVIKIVDDSIEDAYNVIGEIDRIDRDRKGHVTGILVDGSHSDHYFHVTDETILPYKDLELGMTIVIEYNGISTYSLPPQSTADVVTIIDDDIIEDAHDIIGEIDRIDRDRRGNVTGVLIDGDYSDHYFHVTDQTILPYMDLETGMLVKVIYDGTATRSMPPQSTADIILIK